MSVFSEKVLSGMKELRDNGLLCDVILVVESERFPVHRVVLSSVSEYFRTMFLSEYEEARAKEITLKGPHISSMEMKILLAYIYSGKLEITAENMYNVLGVADFLQCKAGVVACCNFIENYLKHSLINLESYLSLADLADVYDIELLRQISNCYLSEHFMNIIDTESFYEISAQKLLNILRMDNLSVPNEQVVFEVVLKWLKHKWTERKQFVYEMLSNVRLSFVDINSLSDFMSESKEIRDECADLLLQVLYSQSMIWKNVNPPSSVCKPRAGSAKVLVACYCKTNRYTFEFYDSLTKTWRDLMLPQIPTSVRGEILISRSYEHCIFVTKFSSTVSNGNSSIPKISLYLMISGEKEWKELPALETHRKCGVVSWYKMAVVGGNVFLCFNTGVCVRFNIQAEKWQTIGSAFQELTMKPALFDILEYKQQDKCIMVYFSMHSKLITVQFFDEKLNEWFQLSQQTFSYPKMDQIVIVADVVKDTVIVLVMVSHSGGLLTVLKLYCIMFPENKPLCFAEPFEILQPPLSHNSCIVGNRIYHILPSWVFSQTMLWDTGFEYKGGMCEVDADKVILPNNHRSGCECYFYWKLPAQVRNSAATNVELVGI